MRLILFDVDGTLLDAGGLSRRVFLNVVRGIAGEEASLDGYSLSGKTDPQIMRELLVANGLTDAAAERAMEEALAAYREGYLAGLSQSAVRPLGGARELIARLASSAAVARAAGAMPEVRATRAIGAAPAAAAPSHSLILGLLTGNLEPLVAPKLTAAGFSAEAFVVGAYGSDHADRNELPAIAVAKAQHLCGTTIAPREVFIVGDTPLDVRCAKHFGAVSIAVASGDYTYEELAGEGPDCVLESLSSLSRLEREIGCRL